MSKSVYLVILFIGISFTYLLEIFQKEREKANYVQTSHCSDIYSTKVLEKSPHQWSRTDYKI